MSTSIVTTATAISPLIIERGDADEDDGVWLERLVNTFSAGMKAAQAAAIEIARNWTKGRKVGRLWPDYTDAAGFLKDYVGTIRLPREERDQFIVALIGSGMSRRGAAKVTGVSHPTANRAGGGTNVPRSRRTSKHEPTAAERLARDIDGILGPKATLPSELDRWLIGPITENERAAVYQALDRLGGRIADLKRSISS